MRFRNKSTGNIVTTENKTSVKLMQASDQYEEVKESTAKKSTKRAADASSAE